MNELNRPKPVSKQAVSDKPVSDKPIGRRLTIKRILQVAATSFALSAAGSAFAIDQSYAAFDSLLKKHVAWNTAGVASSVNYKGFAADHGELKKVLEELSALSKTEYDAMKRDEKLAYLINVYNAYTIELILTKYPDVKSIKDLGSFTQSPWKKKFFRVFGEERNLDNIEHDMIRAPGVFDEPRIHFAVVCAARRRGQAVPARQNPQSLQQAVGQAGGLEDF
jgi:Protein of unknown function, DUF547